MVQTGRFGWSDDGPVWDAEPRRHFDPDDPLDDFDLSELKSDGPPSRKGRSSVKRTSSRNTSSQQSKPTSPSEEKFNDGSP